MLSPLQAFVSLLLLTTTTTLAKDAVDAPRQIEGYRTIYGAIPSTRPTPVPPRYVFGAERDWQKHPFRVATVLIDFPDKQHDPVHSAQLYDKLLFSHGEYLKQPDDKPSFGSLADWYAVQSQGHFVLTGKVFDWVTVEEGFEKIHGMKLTDAKEPLFKVALAKVLARDGPTALEGFDAYILIHAGPITAPINNILWSHQDVLDGRRYFTTGEIERIGVFCHEWGHVLGLPDLYAKEGVREGFGPWCAMETGYRGLYPKSFCVWSKTRLGWCRPTVLDAHTPQKLVLRAIQQYPDDAFIIPLNAHDGIGAEFLMLENRSATGNDIEGQAGLFIWRIKRKPSTIAVPLYELKLPGPRDTPKIDPKTRRVAWPDGDARDFVLPADGANLSVALHNIRIERDFVFFDLGPN